MALRKYWTGLRSPHGEFEHDPYSMPRYGTSGWHITFEPVLRSKTSPLRAKPLKGGAPLPPERDLYIYARSHNAAQRAASLLFASKSLVEGTAVEHFFIGWDPYTAFPVDASEYADMPPERAEYLIDKRGAYTDFSTLGSGFTDAAFVASRLARRSAFTFAAFKYLLSVYLIRVAPMDLHPRWGENFKTFRSSFPMDWVWFSHSVFAAFGVIEELRLTVTGASGSRPSVVNGQWNTEIRRDIEKRLEAIGIATDKTITWHIRGGIRKFERWAARRITQKASPNWVGGEVRDIDILYIDAINLAQMMRSSIAAHVGQLETLSAVEVANVQHLARMLLLHAIRFHFWETQKGKLRREADVKGPGASS